MIPMASSRLKSPHWLTFHHRVAVTHIIHTKDLPALSTRQTGEDLCVVPEASSSLQNAAALFFLGVLRPRPVFPLPLPSERIQTLV